MDQIRPTRPNWTKLAKSDRIDLGESSVWTKLDQIDLSRLNRLYGPDCTEWIE